ncbi:DUF927 domain-containing protein [Maridesulfovibrio sp.]|uniref:DUF927 domain-containing protein n=1 Tax=Maridesulfovibrio sp. TaxID=2795000 RepID=UPI0029CA13D4|nr:DUF927 domain-containing protein [Maridesulfovibrio sp.]
MRYRYALFADGRVECFEDSVEARISLIRKGAKSFSVYVFSDKLGNSVSPIAVWGDLHLYFASRLAGSDFASFLYQFRVPSSSVRVFKHSDMYEFVVSEEAFRGDFPYISRIQTDLDFQRKYLGVPSEESYFELGGNNILSSEVELLGDDCLVPLEFFYSKYSHIQAFGVSLLSKSYNSLNLKYRGRLRSVPMNNRFMKRCKVLQGFLESERLSDYQIRFGGSLFRNDIAGLRSFLTRHGRHEIGDEDFSIEFCESGRNLPVWCCDVPKLLKENGYPFQCREFCGVSTPEALPYAAFPPELGALHEEYGEFLLTRTGLFADVFLNDDKIRICPPIWVEGSFNGEQGMVGARAVVFYDVEGNRKQLVVDEMVVDSPKLFALLREHGFECPTGKTEKGLLRKFLVQQYPRKNKREDAVAVEESGWHKDGFVPPRSELKVSSYKLKSVLIPPESAGNLELARFDNKENWEAEEELATYLSLLAPLLGLVKHKGICFHFHGGREQQRDSILSAVNYAWGDWLVPKVCSADDLTTHISALTKLHNDLPLCVREVGSSDKAQNKMRTFLRRYFLGRKGDNKPVRGVVVSTGAEPLTPAKDRRLGRWGYVYDGDVLLIDIPVGRSNFGATEKVPAGFGKVAVHEIQKDNDQFSKLLRSAHKEFKRALVTRKSSRVFSEIVRVFSMICCVEYYLVGKQELTADFVSSDIRLARYIRMVHDLDTEKDYFRPDAVRLAKICTEFFNFRCVPIAAGIDHESCMKKSIFTEKHIIIPADDFKKMWSDDFPFGSFTAWLRKEKILVPFKRQGVCGTHHYPKLKKSVRSYKINKKRLIELTRG